jgi:hypothetical protein
MPVWVSAVMSKVSRTPTSRMVVVVVEEEEEKEGSGGGGGRGRHVTTSPQGGGCLHAQIDWEEDVVYVHTGWWAA